MSKKKETKRHAEAFVFYFNLKQDEDPDAMQKTADQFGVKIGTLYNWSCDYDWKERYEEADRKAKEKALKKHMRKIEKAEIDNIAKTIDIFYKVAGNIGPAPNSPSYSVKDFETISKLLTLLTGGATERVENNNTEKMSEEDWEAIQALNGSIESLMNEGVKEVEEKTGKE